MIRGLVLAGGKSSRFGSDKALAVYDGVRLVERAVSLLDSLGLKPIVSLRRGADYAFLNCLSVYDRLPDEGPLGGLYTALSTFKDVPFLVVTCDMPALNEGVLTGLLNGRKPGASMTVYSVEGRVQPFPGIYEPSLLESVRAQLKLGRRSLQALIEAASDVRQIEWEGDTSPFLNVNRREDLVV